MDKDIRVLKPDQLQASLASGGMTRLAAISAQLVGSEGIYMGLSHIPVGLRSSPHVHTNCESALYVAAGRGRLLVGQHLERSLDIAQADFLYVPPDAPHVVINDGDVPLVLVIARNTQVEVVAEYDPDAGAVAAFEEATTPLETPLLMRRCKSCRVPIRGPLAVVSRLRGIGPYAKNPQLCTRCEKRIKGSEERVVTALFADIRGSTSLSTEGSREEYLSALRQFFHAATSAVYELYGVVDRFLGDGILVFFNASVPRETHAEDAVRAAIAIQERLADAQFGVGIGIESGLVTAGNPDLGEVVDFTCIGEAVNIASRLQALADAREVVIGPSAWPSVCDLVAMRGIPSELEMAEIKGAGTVEVRRLRLLRKGGGHG